MIRMTRSPIIERLWREHLEASRRWDREREVQGIDLELLDANTSQCVLTYMDSGSLGSWKAATLRQCLEQLGTVIPHLDGVDRIYCERLRNMARAVMAAVDDVN